MAKSTKINDNKMNLELLSSASGNIGSDTDRSIKNLSTFINLSKSK